MKELNPFKDISTADKRNGIYWAGKHILQAEIEHVGNGLKDAENHLTEGKPVLIIQNHFSQSDPMVVEGHIVFGSDVMREREQTNVSLAPIVTEETLKKPKWQHLKKNEGLADYKKRAIKTMKNGGVVLVTPQGTRQPNLPAEPENKAIATLVLSAKHAKVDNLGFLFVGVGIKGEDNYGSKKTRGWNIRRPFELKVGEFKTLDKALEETGNIRNLDKWVYQNLSPLVPEAYRRA
jgi:hypothetical protein